MWRKHGFFRDYRNRNICDATVFRAHYVGDALQKLHAVGVVVAGVVHGIEVPDVLFAEGGEDCVHDGVHRGVAVGVRDEGERAGDFFAAELYAFALLQTVYVVAEAREPREQIVLDCDFDVFGVAVHHLDRAVGELVDKGEIVEEIPASRGVCAFYAFL